MTQLSERTDNRDQPALKKLHVGPTIEEIAKIAKKTFGARSKASKEIGEKYEISESGVTLASSRFSKEIAEDKVLQKMVKLAVKKCGLSIA